MTAARAPLSTHPEPNPVPPRTSPRTRTGPRVSETIDYLRTVLAGERGEGGFKLPSPPAEPVPILLAALRDRMLRLAADKADAVFTNFLPLSNVEQVVRAYGRPEKEIACRFFAIHGPEDEAVTAAKRTFVAYATVPVYAEFFRWLGRGDEIEPLVDAWNAGDRKGALELAPEARPHRGAARAARRVRRRRHRHRRARFVGLAGGASAGDRRVRPRRMRDATHFLVSG